MQNNMNPVIANIIPVSKFAVIDNPKYFATQGKTKEAATTKEALTKNFRSLYRMKTVNTKAKNIKIVVKLISIAI
ncbi:MAG: hypothetical protein GTN40_02290 [Candidatus Aenigmarchaeota archaeon]|nr:hypothetical protein [Candidatus Aenigmarchaeota archaeon]